MAKFGRFVGFMMWLAVPMSLLGQFETAEVLGTVTDASGAAVPQASVTLTNQDTGIQAKATTGENGNYNFFNVRVGRYAIVVERDGFAKFTTSNVTVNVNARQRVNVTLAVGAVTESVEVSGAAAAIETDSSEHGQVINTRQIVELPLNGRNYSDLALLATNVHKSPIAGSREGSFNANGMRSTYNNFLMDGMDNNAYSTSNQGFSNQVAQPSPDAVAEFKVITSNFSAEYGRVGGAVVNVVMRSGTNQIHGTLYEFLRNTKLNAVGFFKPAGGVKPIMHRNQFGGTIGGPFIKNKLFFFADYEGYRALQKTYYAATIPNMNDRAGILPVTVANPLTGTVYAAGTKIPMTAFASKVLSDLPTVAAGAQRANNYTQLLLNPRDNADKYDAKVDGQINDKTTVFVRFSQRKDNQFTSPSLEGPSGGSGNGYVRSLSQAAVLGTSWTLTPTQLLEFRLSFTHMRAGKEPPFLGGQSMEALYGITGLPTFSDLAGGLNTQNISGFTGIIGRQATNPQFQHPTTWNPKVNYTLMKGRHALKVGGEMHTIHTQVMDINPVYGLLGYAGSFSKPSCAQLGQPSGCTIANDATSYNLADFLFGLPNQIQLANWLVGNYRQRDYFLYLQDDFHVSSKLTLNLGMRWEFATPRWERDNMLSNYDPSGNRMVMAKNGSLYDRTLVDPDYQNWAPRLGMAYNFTSKTVFRGGYGISYVHLNRLGSADLLGINGPQVNIATINQSMPGGKPPASFLTTEKAFRPGLASPENFNPVNANVAYIPRDTRWPYVQTWFASVQRELPMNWVLELGYTGSHSLRAPILSDYNQARPNLPGQSLGTQARRPNQAFGAITWVNPAGQTSYNGLSLRAEHRFAGGLYFLNSFTWSKALGNSEQALENNVTVQNIHDLRNERGPTSYDVTLVNMSSLVYQAPFGRGRKYGSNWNGLLDAILGGWEFSSINTANSGLPVNISYTPSSALDATGRLTEFRGVATQRPNLVGDPQRPDGASMIATYWNRAAFAVPTASEPFGNVGRNSFRAPGLWELDMALNKRFQIPLREGMSLQFRGEFFNVLNRTNFGSPSANITSAAFGTINNTGPARQIQLALKLMF